MLDNLIQDLRFAIRLILRRPLASLVIVLTLTLGIVANVAMFSGFDAWVLSELDFPEPDRVVSLTESQPERSRFHVSVSAPNLRDWRDRQLSFEELGAFRRAIFNFNDEENPERIPGALVTAELFPVLGVQPVRGRNFTPPEDDPGGGDDRVLISDRFWRTRLDSDPEILGKAVRIDGRIREVVGVMEPGFRFPEWADLWLPLVLDPAVEDRAERRLDIVARLKSGVTIEQAAGELKEISRELERVYPETNRGWSAEVRTLREEFVPPVIEVALTASLVSALLLLLVICANVASLFLAQATARRQETALRAALGAKRSRLVRQWLTECILLALMAGAAGAALSDPTIDWMKSWVPVQVPYLFEFGFDARALAYTLLISLLAGVACSLAPVVRNSGLDVFQALKKGAGGLQSRGGGFLRSALVTSEFALAMALVIGALLMVRSFINQQSIDPGFSTRDLVTLDLSMTGEELENPQSRMALLDRVLRGLDELPEVSSAGAVTFLPVSNGYEIPSIELEGRALPPEERPRATLHTISREYLATLELPVQRGRGFTAEESSRGGDVVLVSASLAELLWPGADPLGRRLRLLPAQNWRTVVGVVGDVHTGHRMVSSGSLPENEQAYLPLASTQRSSFKLVLRSSAPLSAVTPRIRQILRTEAPGLPISEVITMDAAIHRVQWVMRYFSETFLLYALLALGIATLGVYGVTADSVSRRTREIAVRRALGATRKDLLRLVVRQGLLLAGLGALLGTLLALAMTGFMGSMLYGVGARDPLIFLGVGVLILLVGSAASLLSARQVLQTNMMAALRSE